jgi:hypothetical protein
MPFSLARSDHPKLCERMQKVMRITAFHVADPQHASHELQTERGSPKVANEANAPKAH